MDLRIRGGFPYLLALVLAACGRTGLEPRVGGSDAATASPPDTAQDQRSAGGRTCRWAGFASQANYSGAGDAIAVGDFDGDGHDDIVVSAWGNGVREGTASVFLNRGDGAFALPATYAANLEAQSVALGDFSGDGKLDFAVTNGLRDLDLFVNLGDGTFAPRARLNGPQEAVVMAAADFNRDGHPDLAFTTQMHWIAVIFGDGAGGFGAPLTLPTGINVNSIAVSDFNRDGYPDLVVTNADWAGTCPGSGALCLPTGLAAGTVNVIINQGDGTFAPQSSYAAGNGTEAVATGDFNADGAPDIAATNSVDGTLSVFFNTGEGVFTPQVTYPNAGSGTSALGEPFPGLGGGVAAADFDGDGHVDIVVMHGSQQDRNTGVILVLANQGDGTFRDPLAIPTTGFPIGFTVGDFNGDGLPDLAAVMVGETLSVFLSKCE